MTVATPAPASRSLAVDSRGAVALARRVWRMTCDGTVVLVRGAVPADLPVVARLHGRCSADTLLQRYLLGGRPPSLATLAAMLTQPLALAAFAPDGEVVSFATALTSPMRAGADPLPARALSFGLVVEDAWQGRGIGRALAGHVAAGAHLLGVRELVTDTASTMLPLRRVLEDVGPTRGARGSGGSRLYTRLDLSSLSGLGSLRDVLAG